MVKKKKSRSGRAAVAAKRGKISDRTVRYRCLKCGVEEDVPKSAVELMEIFDDIEDYPLFDCKKCEGVMEPINKDMISYNESEVIHIVSRGIPEDDGDYMF